MCASDLKWITDMGVKYTFTEYVLIGWQDDDLPAFGQIQCIVVMEGIVLFTVTKYHTLGIDWHFHSCVIDRSDEVQLCPLSELVYYHPFGLTTLMAINTSHSALILKASSVYKFCVYSTMLYYSY